MTSANYSQTVQKKIMYVLHTWRQKQTCDEMLVIGELQELGVLDSFIVFLGLFCKFEIMKNKI